MDSPVMSWPLCLPALFSFRGSSGILRVICQPALNFFWWELRLQLGVERLSKVTKNFWDRLGGYIFEVRKVILMGHMRGCSCSLRSMGRLWCTKQDILRGVTWRYMEGGFRFINLFWRPLFPPENWRSTTSRIRGRGGDRVGFVELLTPLQLKRLMVASEFFGQTLWKNYSKYKLYYFNIRATKSSINYVFLGLKEKNT